MKNTEGQGESSKRDLWLKIEKNRARNKKGN